MTRRRRRARSGPSRSRIRRPVPCPSTCRSRLRPGTRTLRRPRRHRPAGPRSAGRGRRHRPAPGRVSPRATSSQGRAPTTARGAISRSGVVTLTASSTTVDRHSSWVGGKNSAFHDPGPTAQPKTFSSSPCSRRYRPGACTSWVPTGRSATRLYRSGHDRPVTDNRTFRLIPETGQCRDERVQPFGIDHRGVTDAHGGRLGPKTSARQGRKSYSGDLVRRDGRAHSTHLAPPSP